MHLVFPPEIGREIGIEREPHLCKTVDDADSNHLAVTVRQWSHDRIAEGSNRFETFDDIRIRVEFVPDLD